MSIITHVLLTIFATVLASGDSVRDLCDVVNKRTGGPVYCEPHSVGAPTYDSTVCCDGSSCLAAPGGRCPTDQQLFYCEFGEQWATGEVACYFEVPEYCDVFACPHQAPPGYSWYPQADNICCEFGICVPYVTGECAEQSIYGCGSVVCNQDGTVTCVDWEGE